MKATCGRTRPCQVATRSGWRTPYEAVNAITSPPTSAMQVEKPAARPTSSATATPPPSAEPARPPSPSLLGQHDDQRHDDGRPRHGEPRRPVPDEPGRGLRGVAGLADGGVDGAAARAAAVPAGRACPLARADPDRLHPRKRGQRRRHPLLAGAAGHAVDAHGHRVGPPAPAARRASSGLSAVFVTWPPRCGWRRPGTRQPTLRDIPAGGAPAIRLSTGEFGAFSRRTTPAGERCHQRGPGRTSASRRPRRR